MNILISAAMYTGLNVYVFKSNFVDWNQHSISLINACSGVLGILFLSNHQLACHLLGYTIWDLSYRLWHYNKLIIMSSMFHHAVYGTTTYIAITSNKFLNLAPYIAIGELSTIFLDVRWMLQNLKAGEKTKEFILINKLFVTTFFITRVCLFSRCLVLIQRVTGVWTFAMYYCACSVISMYILNLYWFYIILKKIQKYMLLNNTIRRT